MQAQSRASSAAPTGVPAGRIVEADARLYLVDSGVGFSTSPFCLVTQAAMFASASGRWVSTRWSMSARSLRVERQSRVHQFADDVASVVGDARCFFDGRVFDVLGIAASDSPRVEFRQRFEVEVFGCIVGQEACQGIEAV